ncbi:GGDEF domain-containing protein [Vibrio penaeicida]|uniref:Diguanylate cyclase n=1 Tax=Vibrio penaeicida TaxID=104609 RepID=A0AAV5NWA5_9VIBR|nr:GGDEF domain-containing protein [Vibrio penaeicida]RTZ22135.1 GGDEF domain-containing protein [Vibrio penaeicida]GLQ74860.1 diguanylate cyclase [Vibrio penaeicida]
MKKIAALLSALLALQLMGIKVVYGQKSQYIVATEADDVVTHFLFDMVSEEFSVEVVYKDMPDFESVLGSVARGESDFAANVTHTDDRDVLFEFSAPTNIEYTYLFSPSGVSLSEAEIIGVPKNTIYADLISHNFPNIKLIEYNGYEEAKNLLLSGEVNGVVDAINQLKAMLTIGLDAQLLNDQISIKPVSIISPKGQNKDEIQRIVDFVHSESMQKKLRSHISQYQFDIRRDALRRDMLVLGLRSHQTFRVKLENAYPYVEYNDKGLVRGISADTVKQACHLLTFTCEIVSTHDESWESMYGDLIDKKIDILAPLTISEQRKNIAYFSVPHYFPEAIIVKRLGFKPDVYRHVSELITERIGVVRDDFFDELLSQLLPQKTFIRYSSQEELVNALVNDEIDYIAVDKATLNILLKEQELLPITQDYSIESFHSSEIALGFPKTTQGEVLAALFSRAIRMLDTASINSTYDKQPDWRNTLEREQDLANKTKRLFMVAIAFVLLVAYLLYRQANTDSLTKLENRRALNLKYSRGIKPWQTVIYLDINDFKQINDQFGHDVGDRVIQTYASIIRRNWKGNWYRIGGDEFILICSKPLQDKIKILKNLKLFSFYMAERDRDLSVSVSIGVFEPRQKEYTLREILIRADEAMYQSKRKGEPTFVDTDS